MSLNVAVVGVGRWGVNHVRVLSLLQSHLVGRLVVVDSDISRASQVAKTYHADTFYGSVEELSRREKDLDAVIVVVPTIYHYKVVDKLLDNYDVFVEKPLAETIEQGFNLVQKARRLGRVLAVGHIERFNPIVLVSRRMLEQLNGKILSFEAKRLGPGPARSYSLNLGVAHDLLVHDLDVSVFLLGNLPSKVYAQTFRTNDFPYEVEVEAVYQYPGGKTAHLIASWRTSPKYKHRSFSVRTEDFILTADYILRRINIDNGIDSIDVQKIKTAIHNEVTSIEISYLQEEPLKLELIDFLESVSTRRKPIVSALEGYIALKGVVKALESAVKEAPVEISWEELANIMDTV
ncbi:MAG: Gfo/Idh/MocA family oxidoreductase [Infirmifilum sp.]|uniref:Gfo/Idh/MocA-like oxidoreductase N-terminal domain-containing protein n=1 Tax=Infirmifilum uzonense TaxID=1550241 RepID=A0A0F7FI93_9CREN|nr:Gfo/Idh/MocA family oxidoreductase [Infirmifilum uzonense]AKG38910.1 hypothetical protein MA03_06125 [Infirmifilum uzonense]